MDSEDDMLYYSHQKLSNLILKKGDKNAAIKEYLDNLHYQAVDDFPKGLEWFNVSEPLSFAKHLKGKVVVLDFFTYCCINCMHILPDLKEIEEQFSVEDGLVVIGVHSAKFENEKISSNILSAVQRYNITHPVVNDHNSSMWKNCDINCWPTLLILGPNANPIVMLMGEGHKENLQLYIQSSLEYYKSKKLISKQKLPLQSAYHLLPDLKGPLLFPGKITNIIDANGVEKFAISDSGNHRILIVKADGAILRQIGGSTVGFKDGPLEKAQFNSPQGLVFRDADTLLVADTENHAIRRVDLKKGMVDTVAGTGVQGHDRIGGKLWTQQAISSPWDLCIFKTPNMDMSVYPHGDPPLKDVVLIAMAGSHQIWALFLEDTVWWKCKPYPAGTCLCIAGSGREENRNNSYPQSAAFAQPSGLALCSKNKEVYIADSESSSIRRLSLADGKVSAVVGGDKNPNNLFAFGDKDGTLFDAKLQHSLGVAMSKDESVLFVADTYNHKLKKINISQNKVTTLTPPAARDTTDSKGKHPIFNEPAGLCVDSEGTKLYLADTNNHSIKVLHLNNDFSISSIEELDLVSAVDNDKTEVSRSEKLTVLKHKGIAVSEKGGKAIIKVVSVFQNGLKVTEGAPQKWSVTTPNPAWSCVPNSGNDIEEVDVVVSVPKGKADAIEVAFDIVTCTAQTCFPKNYVVRIPITFKKNGLTSVEETVKVGLGPSNVNIL